MNVKNWQASEPWVGLLAGPLVFLINLQVNFSIVSWVCSTRNYLPIHFAHVVSILIVAWAGLLSHRAYVRAGRGVPGEAGDINDRERFISMAGMLLSLFSIVSLIAHWMPNVILGPCQ